MDLVEGNMVSLTNNKDKSRTSAAIYMHENKLYIIEGTSPAAYPVPDWFQQEIGWLDADGNGIRYQTIYHNGFHGTSDRAAWRRTGGRPGSGRRAGAGQCRRRQRRSAR